MSNQLQNRMTWTEIADHIKFKAYPNEPEGFKEWFLTKEYLGYKTDPQTYGRAYHIYLQLRDDYDHITVFVGKERKGKSSFASFFMTLISPNFSLKNYFFKQSVFIDALIEKPPKQDGYLADEGGLIFFSRDSQSKSNKDIVKIMTVMGSMNLHVGICIVNYWLLDTYIRDHRVGTIFRITDRGVFTAYTGDIAFSIISNYGYKNFKRFDGIKVPNDSTWNGYWNKGFIEVNDITEDKYKEAKSKAYNEYLNEVKKNCKTEEEMIDNVTTDYYVPSALATILGVTHKTILDRCHAGDIPFFKIGTQLYIPKKFMTDKLDNCTEPVEKIKINKKSKDLIDMKPINL